MKSDKTKPSILILYTLPVLLFSLTAVLDINPSGIRTYHAPIDLPSPHLSQLFPAQRLEGTSEGMQRVLAEPIYFTVRYPRPYDVADVSIRVRNPEAFSWQIGLQQSGDDEWAYTLKTPDANGEASFSLRGARVSDRWIRFIIAIDSHDSSIDQFYIDDIKVTLRDE